MFGARDGTVDFDSFCVAAWKYLPVCNMSIRTYGSVRLSVYIGVRVHFVLENHHHNVAKLGQTVPNQSDSNVVLVYGAGPHSFHIRSMLHAKKQETRSSAAET